MNVQQLFLFRTMKKMLVMAKSNDKSAADDVKLTVDINDKSREQVTVTQHILTFFSDSLRDLIRGLLEQQARAQTAKLCRSPHILTFKKISN